MKIQINDVSLRDGLQNRKEILSLQQKLDIYDELIKLNFPHIEVGAFVRPDRIPQMADTDQFLKAIATRGQKKRSWSQHVLVPNSKGLENLESAQSKFAPPKKPVDVVSLFTAASETFVKKNINMSIDESLDEFKRIVEMAKKSKLKMRGYVSTAFVCPFEGAISPKQTLKVVKKLLEMGCYEVSIGDTIGAATPREVERFWKLALAKYNRKFFAGHFHDTYGTALANVTISLAMGIQSYDAAIGGLGGCPFAPGASGNLATEDLVYLLEGLGFKLPTTFQKVCESSRLIFSKLPIQPTSKALHAYLAKNPTTCFT